LKTLRFANSQAHPIEKITKDKLYKNALDLFEIKDELEQFLSKKTNELFDIQDTIYLFDITNTYFEGQKRKSSIAGFGRSKDTSESELMNSAKKIKMRE